MIQDSFKIEANVMKTSELVTWNCKSFTYGFLVFRPKKHKEMKLQSKNSYIFVTTASNSDKFPCKI